MAHTQPFTTTLLRKLSFSIERLPYPYFIGYSFPLLPMQRVESFDDIPRPLAALTIAVLVDGIVPCWGPLRASKRCALFGVPSWRIFLPMISELTTHIFVLELDFEGTRRYSAFRETLLSCWPRGRYMGTCPLITATSRSSAIFKYF